MHPFNHGGAYVNFMMDDEAEGRVEATLRRELRAARRSQGQVRPEQPVPGEPEHQTGGTRRAQVNGAAGWRGGRTAVGVNFKRP